MCAPLYFKAYVIGRYCTDYCTLPAKQRWCIHHLRDTIGQKRYIVT